MLGLARSHAILWLTAAALLIPPVIDLLQGGLSRTGLFLASDAYYYLAIGKNWADLGRFTFDQEYLTNGFHPLWQGLLAGLFGVGRLFNVERIPMLGVVIVVQLVLTSSAYVLVADSVGRVRKTLSPWFPLLLIGLLALLTLTFRRNVGSAWSYVNGMESPVLLLSFAWVIRELLRPEKDRSTKAYLLLGAALGAVFLSRLDHAFLAVAVLGWMGLEAMVAPDRMKRWRRIWPAFLVPALALLGFLLVNRVIFGSWMPVSGALKSSFPIPNLDNWWNLYSLIEDPHQYLRQRRVWRGLQLLVPSAVAVFCLARHFFRRPTDPSEVLWTRGMAILAVFTLVLSGYNFFFVPLNAHGHWYVPTTILFASLYVWDLVDGRLPLRGWSRSPGIALLSAGAAVIFYFTVFAQGGQHQRYERFLERGLEDLRNADIQTAKIVEFDDGIISYVTGWPALSGFGFALDPEGVEALRSSTLLDLAYARGYRHIASVGYFEMEKLTPEATSEEIGELLYSTFHYSPKLVEGWRFEVVARLPESSFVLVAFSPMN